MLRMVDFLALNPMLRIAVLLIAGIAVGELLTEDVAVVVCLSLLATCVTVALMLHRRVVGQSVMLQFCCLLAGVLLTVYEERMLCVKIPETLVTYEGVVISEPVVRGKVIQTDLMVVGNGKPMKVRASILRDTIDCRYERLHLGDGIRATSFMESPQVLPHAKFDYGRWMQLHGYAAQTFIYYSDWQKTAVRLRAFSAFDRVRLRVLKLRQRLVRQYNHAGVEGDDLAIAVAMTLGDKSLLDKSMKEKYSQSGTAHLLALSGLHLSVIYGLLFWLTFGCRRRWLVQAMLLLIVWGYVFMVGMMPSVVRSAVMLTIYAMADLSGRNHQPINTLSLAAVVLLVANPLLLFDVGFELSFMAMLWILLLTPLINELFIRCRLFRWPLMKWLAGMLSVSLAAQFGTAPLTIHYFGSYPCWGFLINIIAVPCATIIVYTAVGLLLLSWQPVIQMWLAKLMVSVIGFLDAVQEWFISLPGSQPEELHWSGVQVCCAYAIMFSAYLMWRFISEVHLIR